MRSKKKFDLFARKKNLNYIAVAFATGGADAPPITKEEKGGKKKRKKAIPKECHQCKGGPNASTDRSTMNGYSDLGRYKWGTKRKLHGFIHSFCAKLKYRLERMSLRY